MPVVPPTVFLNLEPTSQKVSEECGQKRCKNIEITTKITEITSFSENSIWERGWKFPNITSLSIVCIKERCQKYRLRHIPCS